LSAVTYWNAIIKKEARTVIFVFKKKFYTWQNEHYHLKMDLQRKTSFFLVFVFPPLLLLVIKKWTRNTKIISFTCKGFILHVKALCECDGLAG